MFNFLSRKNSFVGFYLLKSGLIEFLFPSDLIISHSPNHFSIQAIKIIRF